ncbi:hypothetical protein J8F10_03205 [Gemmata sp. G18]|uniref:Uncharacterized protein n=1 Tax=Gemmata palustris TaxID=2822762 RepID=A0ABS5BKR9_9BACT|nr:hypothetical protein [Gemmata palustris]MBP3954303.1 hypothetical protein [Gemmata palustris]
MSHFRTGRTLIRNTIISSLAMIISVNSSNGQELNKPIEKRDLIKMCREAWMASFSSPKGVIGSGEFTVQADGKSIVAAGFRVEMSEEKYRIDLDYTKNHDDAITSQAIIREPGTLFIRDALRAGAQQKIVTRGFILKEDHPLILPPFTAFTINSIRFIKAINIEKMKDGDIDKISTLENGDIEILFSKDCKIICSRKYEFNVSLVECYRGGFNGIVVDSESLQWKKHDSTWFPTEITRVHKKLRDGKPIGTVQERLTYKKVDFGMVPLNRFSPDEAGLLPGSRIQDRRPDAKQKDYYWRQSEDSKPSPSLPEAMDRLPTTPPGQSSRFRSTWMILAYSAGGILLLSGAAIVWRSRHSKIEQPG